MDRHAVGRPRRRTISLMKDLSHVDESGAVRMVDVGGKEPMRRRAVARAEVRMAAGTPRVLRALPKGGALARAQLAGSWLRNGRVSSFRSAIHSRCRTSR